MPEPVETWVDGVRDAERRGELLAAFDLAERGLDEHPDDVWLRHRAVLALARAGSTDEALRRFDRYGLGVASARNHRRGGNRRGTRRASNRATFQTIRQPLYRGTNPNATRCVASTPSRAF